MRGGVRVHGPNDAEFIGVPAQVRVDTADGQAALAVILELKSGLRQVTNRSAVGADCLFAGIFLAVEFRECRLGVKGIDMAWAAIHEKKNNVLGLGRKMPRPGGKFPAKGVVFCQQVNQSQPRKPTAGLPQEFTPRLSAGRVVWGKSRAEVHK